MPSVPSLLCWLLLNGLLILIFIVLFFNAVPVEPVDLCGDKVDQLLWHLIPHIASPLLHHDERSHCISCCFGCHVVTRWAPLREQDQLSNTVVAPIADIEASIGRHNVARCR